MTNNNWEESVAKLTIKAHKQSGHYAEFSETLYQGVKDLLTKKDQEGYERGIKETAMKLDSNFAEYIKSPESKWLIDEIKKAKDQEHKAELEKIKGEIEGLKLLEVAVDPESLMWKKRMNRKVQDAICILDSHINKQV